MVTKDPVFIYLIPPPRLAFSGALPSQCTAKLSLSFSSIRNIQSTIFLSSAKRNQSTVAARISPAISISLVSSVFPLSLSLYFSLSLSLSRLQLALSACRPRVSQANFAIKQSDARTAIVMTAVKGKRRKRGGGERSNRFARRLRLI